MSVSVPRYLAPFAPNRVNHFFTDVLILGGGLAGMRAALAVDAAQDVLIVTKDAWTESNSNYAQGGIAGVLSPTDSFKSHIDDTLEAGGKLCDRRVVEAVVEAAPARINELIQWGTQFDRDGDALLLGREGGHDVPRILHAHGDATGREIMRAMIAFVQQQVNIQMWRDTFTIDLLVHDGCCRGALVWNQPNRQTMIWAKQTILATGGTGQIYRESTNPPVATGDGHAMAYRAGVELRDMEFIQFHPTVLYIAGSSRSLITEAMRGEGAHLIDTRGNRFMSRYDDRLELAPRDVVSQAIVNQMEETRSPNVFLDLSHLDAEFVRNRFPGIAATCHKFGIDIATDPIPVRPGAHYMIGGVTVDDRGRTSLPGLLAAGEVTSSGLHGANRLASNSLLEGVVYGESAGVEASREAASMPHDWQALPLRNPEREVPEESLDLDDIRNSLKSLMWRSAGVRRTQAALQEAQKTIGHWCDYVLLRQFSSPSGWVLQNMLVVARLVIEAALIRDESRGVHFRSDYPETDDARWLRHVTFRRPSTDERATGT
ncbi:MAG: L-aspartate oxidase [Planctomycetales bacterium]|nr:L-aspartate oxidase [Planctomycetales bacterium]